MDPNLVKLSSTYPLAPMIYINNFTNENVRTGQIPPPPSLVKDTYSNFGKLIDPNDVLIRSLESQGIQQLYTNNDYKRELKKLNHSILMNYLDLLDILAKSPTALGVTGRTLREEKLEDIQLLFINMHHLINELRPHQARDNIKAILEKQKEQRLEISLKFQQHLTKIFDLLKLCIQSIKINDNDIQCFINELNDLIQKSQSIQQEQSKHHQQNGIDINFNSKINEINENASNQDYELKDKILCKMIDQFLMDKNEL